jgi:hypothetical protein
MLSSTQTCHSANCDKDEDKTCRRVKSIVNIKKSPVCKLDRAFRTREKFPDIYFKIISSKPVFLRL